MKGYMIVCIFIFVLFVTISANANQPSTVRALYIKPADVFEPSFFFIQEYQNIISRVQRHFRDEMQRHEYGAKTFSLETDKNNRPKVTVINSKYSKQEYADKTTDMVSKEILEGELKDKENLYVVVVGGIELVDKIHGGLAEHLDGKTCGGCRGAAVLAAGRRSFSFSIMAHELGHVFGLSHIVHPTKQYLMGNSIDQYPLADYEAHWLSVHPYFNNRGHNWIGMLPEVNRINEPKMIGNSWIKFSIDIEGTNTLHQAQLMKRQNVAVIAWDILSGEMDTAEFLIKRQDLERVTDTWIHIIDSQGNQATKYMRVDIPIELNIDADIEDISDKNNITYLTIASDHSNTITPINKSWQWGSPPWEKGPGSVAPTIPDGYVHPSRHISKYYNKSEWKWFFYGHANSLFVWDISGKNYNGFDSHLFLPNPCGNVAGIEVRFLADYEKEIYNSGEVKAKDQGKHISFDIPTDTKRLILEVFDLGDSACDHYIFVNPHLVYSETFSAPPKPEGKIATKWANLKHR